MRASTTEEFKALFKTHPFLYKPYNSGLFYNESQCYKYSRGIQRGNNVKVWKPSFKIEAAWILSSTHVNSHHAQHCKENNLVFKCRETTEGVPMGQTVVGCMNTDRPQSGISLLCTT